MSAYAKFLKEILSSKRKLEETTVVKLNAHCSAILQNKIPQKCGDPGSFTIPCSLASEKFDKAICDSGASINPMPLFVFKNSKFDKLVRDTLEICITQSSTVDDKDTEIKKVVEALETEDQVVDEEELKKEPSKHNMELKVLPNHLKYYTGAKTGGAAEKVQKRPLAGP
ncbi:uncharacterized protein [Nicotiana sylvestris]|uniref:uncharacterized protein n=1 Tax=Nicotiana sylvestris TaxID=4096 RepID=UPI00388CBB87